MDCTFEGTLIAELDTDEFDAAGQVCHCLPCLSIHVSLFAGNFAFPTASTSSPMSTSSTDNGDNMVSCGFQPSHAGFGQFKGDMLTGKPSTHVAAFNRSPYMFGALVHYACSMPAYYAPFVANMAYRLAPPSDIVFNLAVLKQTPCTPVWFRLLRQHRPASIQ
ncbi:hypothetical protein PHLGIDRAFT_122799 [Phlebiopsis gigantea 11061_1 CR5-6]|uniref:Uncharacterized protein n=1 Tax=Phlebiopsis gigantea (strain 11061_1 CR5-6) TaxID=745531 RepID=A0A0C3PB03_PHLG1|nr:hypothetical protein PHLGIDRAFT_122799 [Phlebiopsis gigantea 11061_1 CR5-6]